LFVEFEDLRVNVMTNAITSDREPPATEKLLERVNALTATTEQMRGKLSRIRAGIDQVLE
jgi:hypothetical protein